MSEYLSEHWIASIIITIFLGAIGSGLWDAALKPASRKFGSVIFTIITFGAKQARDNTYKRAAMGHHELPSLYILLCVLTCGIAFMVLVQLRIYVAVYAPEIMPPSIILQNPQKLDLNIKDHLLKINERALRALKFMSLAGIFAMVILIYRFAAINRMNLITTYFEQSLMAVRPFIDDSKVHLVRQQYALMTSKEQYDAIICELSAVAKNNGASLPDSYV